MELPRGSILTHCLHKYTHNTHAHTKTLESSPAQWVVFPANQMVNTQTESRSWFFLDLHLSTSLWDRPAKGSHFSASTTEPSISSTRPRLRPSLHSAHMSRLTRTYWGCSNSSCAPPHPLPCVLHRIACIIEELTCSSSFILPVAVHPVRFFVTGRGGFNSACSLNRAGFQGRL